MSFTFPLMSFQGLSFISIAVITIDLKRSGIFFKRIQKAFIGLAEFDLTKVWKILVMHFECLINLVLRLFHILPVFWFIIKKSRDFGEILSLILQGLFGIYVKYQYFGSFKKCQLFALHLAYQP